MHTYESVGPHTVTLTASNLCQQAIYSQTLTVYEQALTLHPASAAQEAGAGQALTYTLRLTNSGEYSDAYRLSRLSGHWPLSLAPQETFDLAAGDSQELQVRVSIPLTAATKAQDVSTILASAASGPTATAILSASVRYVDASGVAYLPIIIRR
jgi:hypothetical protein